MSGALPLTIGDVEAAAVLLEGKVERTPLVHGPALSVASGSDLWLKLESLQPTGSFKVRGAGVKLERLPPGSPGVLAVSAGNHAQGVALHAGRLGIRAVIVMPRTTPFSKVRNTEVLGAEVVLHGATFAEAAEHGRALADREELTPVPAYDDPDVVAGQGTVGIEMLRDRPDLDVLCVPVGGGGLIAGCAIAAKALRPDIRIVGVEARNFPSMICELTGGTPPEPAPTIAEGIAVKTPGRLPLAIVRELVDEIVLVSEIEIEAAVQQLVEVQKVVAEGAAAAALAAILARPDFFRGRRVGLVVSGGNIDSNLLGSVLMRGQIRAGRLVRLRCEVDDQPGSLARVSGLIADLGGNILEVYHQRWFYDVPVKRTEIDVVLETRDPEHVDRIVRALREAGIRVELLSATARPASGNSRPAT